MSSVDFDQKAIEMLAQLIVQTIDRKLADAGIMFRDKIKNIKIGADNILPLSIDGVKIKAASIDTAKIKDLSAEVANIVIANIQDLTADTAFVRELTAFVAKIAIASIQSADIDWAHIDELVAEIANIDWATINRARINYAQIDGLTANTALITEAVGGHVQIDDLSVTDANIVDLNANKINAGTLSVERLIIVNEDDPSNSLIFNINAINNENNPSWRTIDATGLTDHTITADKIAAGSITAECLNVSQIFANNALINAITSNNIQANAITSNKIDTAELLASNALIGKITTRHLSSEIGQKLSLTSTDRIELLITRINNSIDELNQYKHDIATFYRFGENYAEIGKQGSPYTNRLDNDSYSIVRNGSPIMQIIQDTEYIGNLRVNKKIVFGDNVNGKYSMSVTPSRFVFRAEPIIVAIAVWDDATHYVWDDLSDCVWNDLL